MNNPVSELFSKAIAAAANKTFEAMSKEEKEGLAWAYRTGVRTEAMALSKSSGIHLRTIYRYLKDYPVPDALLRAWAICAALEIPIEEYYDAVAEQARQRGAENP